MDVNHLEIYQKQALAYEALVAQEDYQGQIWRTLQTICDWDGKIVFDLGTGTGRLVKILLPQSAFVWGFDHSAAMLQVAKRDLPAAEQAHWQLVMADHRHIPMAERSADRIVSGWSLAYLALDQGAQWRKGISETFKRLENLIRSGGTMIILETMGTGFEQPNPPDDLQDYFSFLDDAGFESTWIRTDYRFPTIDDAVHHIRFFFGDELAAQVEAKGDRIVPECTGVWWKMIGR